MYLDFYCQNDLTAHRWLMTAHGWLRTMWMASAQTTIKCYSLLHVFNDIQ